MFTTHHVSVADQSGNGEMITNVSGSLRLYNMQPRTHQQGILASHPECDIRAKLAHFLFGKDQSNWYVGWFMCS